MNAKGVIFILLIFCNCSVVCFSQGKIEKSKDDLKRGSSKERSRGRRSASSSSCDWDNPFLELAGKAFLYISYYSFIGNYGEEYHLHSDLTRHPYYNGWSGNYESSDSLPAERRRFRLDIENKLLYDLADLGGNHLKAKIRPFQYFYMQTDYFQLIEIVRPQESVSSLALFNFTFCYDRLRFEKFNLGWALGVNYVASDVQKVGISAGLNAEAFLFKNLSLYGSMKWGSVNHSPVNELEIQFRVHKNRYFYTVGYEHLKIGLPTYNFLAAGVGIYF
ncbi:MAG TPA: hypothetical protein VHO72_11105 [Bacteroidales bacterium]|nr:hypothetical protein [Bacteroidales bacterium]